MHLYKVYEVNSDGTFADTGKFIEAEPPVISAAYGIEKLGTITQRVAELYGFKEYVSPYYRLTEAPNGYYINTSVYAADGTIGRKNIWYVKKGI